MAKLGGPEIVRDPPNSGLEVFSLPSALWSNPRAKLLKPAQVDFWRTLES